ncbi:LamG-like jellyroll fold domain-containing protein [Deinococcus wulumuqiensis]
MNFRKNTVRLAAAALTMSLLLTSCPGEQPPANETITGVVIDGLVSGASVFWDCNDNYLLDDSERQQSVLTNVAGQFTISKSRSICPLTAYVPQGSKDSDYPDATLSSPYTLRAAGNNYSVISPLTTLVSDYSSQNKVSDVNVAEKAIQAKTGISTSLLTNYIATSDYTAKSLGKMEIYKLQSREKCTPAYGAGAVSLLECTSTTDLSHYIYKYNLELKALSLPSEMFKVRSSASILNSELDKKWIALLEYVNTHNLVNTNGDIIWRRVPNRMLQEFVDDLLKQDTSQFPPEVSSKWAEAKEEKTSELKYLTESIKKTEDVNLWTSTRDFFTADPTASWLYFWESWKIAGDSAKAGLQILTGLPLNKIIPSDSLSDQVKRMKDTNGMAEIFYKCIDAIDSAGAKQKWVLPKSCVDTGYAAIDLASSLSQNPKDFKSIVKASKLMPNLYYSLAMNDEDALLQVSTILAGILDMFSNAFELAGEPKLSGAFAMAREGFKAQISAANLAKSVEFAQEADRIKLANDFTLRFSQIKQLYYSNFMDSLDFMYTSFPVGTTTITITPAQLSIPAVVGINSTPITATVSGSTNTGLTWTALKADGTTPAPEVTFHAVGPTNPNFPVNKLSTIAVTVSTPGKYVLKATADADPSKFATVQVDATAPAPTVAIATNPIAFSMVAGTTSKAITATVTGSTTTSVKWSAYQATDLTTPTNLVTIAPNNASNTITVTSTTPGKYVLKAMADAEKSKVATVDMEVIEAPVSQGPIAHYTFDDCANLGKDSIGKHDGKPTNNVTCVDGINGKAAQFGGYDNPGWIQVPNSTEFDLDTGVTYSVWVKMNSTEGEDGYGSKVASGAHGLLSKGGDRYGYSFMTAADPSTGACRGPWLVSYQAVDSAGGKGPGVPESATTPTCVGQWNNFAVTIKSDRVELFVNGELMKSDNGNYGNTEMNTADLFLGVSNEGSWYPLNGALDSVRIYRGVLSADMIRKLYEAR